MIPILDGFHLSAPKTLDDALAEMAAHPGARPFAGGTDLMVQLEAGQLAPGRFVSLVGCAELRGIQRAGDDLSIGALTTYADIRASSIIAEEYPLLVTAASETGGPATQNSGTIGGNIANASPAADTPPALLVYDAELELRSSSGVRRVAYVGFHRGYKQMDLRPGEVIARVLLPARRDRGWRDYYRKVGTRRAQAISKVCIAGSILMSGEVVADLRIGLGSVGPTVVRAVATEAALRGERLDAATIARGQDTLAREIAPIDDVRSTARYRAAVAGNLLADFLGGATERK